MYSVPDSEIFLESVSLKVLGFRLRLNLLRVNPRHFERNITRVRTLLELEHNSCSHLLFLGAQTTPVIMSNVTHR